MFIGKTKVVLSFPHGAKALFNVCKFCGKVLLAGAESAKKEEKADGVFDVFEVCFDTTHRGKTKEA